MAWVAVAVAGSAIVSGVVSNNASKRASKAADKAQASADYQSELANERIQQGMSKLESLTPPNLMQYIQPYQQAVVQGTLTPEEAVFKMQEDSRLNGIKIPDQILNMQQMALTKISEIADQGGLTATDRAKLYDIREQQAATNRGMQEAIMQNAQQRGVAGSGLELQQRLLAQQATANQAARQGVDVAAAAQQARLQAIRDQASMAGQMNEQSFGQQKAVAEANDVINRYNNAGWNSAQAANVAARNTAQATNLAEKQRVYENNLANQQKYDAAKLAAAQQQWTNTFNQATNYANTAVGAGSAAQQASSDAAKIAAQQNQQAAAQQANTAQQFGNAMVAGADIYKKFKTPAETTTVLEA